MARKVSTPPDLSKFVSNTDNPTQVLNEIVANVMMTRTNLLEKLLDPRRDIETECGYPSVNSLTANTYSDLYDTHPIANRVVSIFPKECWKVYPEVYETEDNDEETEFEKAWKELCNSFKDDSLFKDDKYNPIWEILRRADIVSGIGHFGVILLGFNDGRDFQFPLPGFEDPNEPASSSGDNQLDKIPRAGTDDQYYDFAQGYFGPNASEGQLKLIFAKVFDEALVEVSAWENRKESKRYGLPVKYRITLVDLSEQTTGVGQPNSTIDVHWSRVIHIADNIECNETIGVPRMRPVIRPLADLKKVYGGSAEGYWQVCLPGVVLESEPGTEIENVEATKQTVQNYIHRLQRWLSLSGMTAKTLQGNSPDPGSHIDTQLDAICIQIGVPKRIFVGSERGELASTQDKDSWEERLIERRNMYVIPRIVVPFVDRLIKVGALPTPKSYNVKWESAENLSKLTKTQIASQITDILSKYIAGGVDTLVEPTDFLTEVVGWDQKQVEEFLKNTVEHISKANPQTEGEIVPGRNPTPPQLNPQETSTEQKLPEEEKPKPTSLNPSVVKRKKENA